MTMSSKEPAEAGEPIGAGADGPVPAVWPGFSIARLPRIMFGGGTSGELSAVVREFGQKALVIVRGPSFTASPDWARIRAALESGGVEFALELVSGEPSPTLVDEIGARHRGSGSASGPASFDVVVGIGGGSVLD